MMQKEMHSKKRNRIKINNIHDFKSSLKKEGYKINEYKEEDIEAKILKAFNIDDTVAKRLCVCINDNEIAYKANDIDDFIDYVEKIVLFEDEHNKLCEKMNEVKKLYIDRIEYEREPSVQDNVKHMMETIEKTKNNVCRVISEEEKAKLKELEIEIDKNYIYAKDIELLKKMVLIKKENVKEQYDDKTRIKTISIEIPEKISCEYIKAKEGTVEYHDHLNNNIPRIKRLRKNINKYMKNDENEKKTFKIDQSKALQDSINIAVAIYDNKQFGNMSTEKKK